jgi:tRNA-dihydrouridine synthase
MDWTDIHYRQLARLLSKHTWLYTEMVVDSTLQHNPNTDRFLWFPEEQRPLVCQLGGSNPETLAAAARKVAAFGYDEINLNCGCPRCGVVQDHAKRPEQIARMPLSLPWHGRACLVSPCTPKLGRHPRDHGPC